MVLMKTWWSDNVYTLPEAPKAIYKKKRLQDLLARSDAHSQLLLLSTWKFSIVKFYLSVDQIMEIFIFVTYVYLI